MNGTHGMENLAPLLIGKALDGLYARQAATAQNIANANSDRYQPVRVTFEQSLRAAAAQGPDAIRDVTPQLELAPVPGIATEMRLDLEIATASATGLRYAALIAVMEGRASLMRTAVSGGR
jgi:flagellar basal-body rod protein FlgB